MGVVDTVSMGVTTALIASTHPVTIYPSPMTVPTQLPFVKMNGLGNEILVIDLRGTSHVLSAAEVRALDELPGAHFDQAMVLHYAQDGRHRGLRAHL